MADTILGLEHEHTAFSEAVANVKALIAEDRGPAQRNLVLRVRLQSLCDELLVHFAREEESLFPYLLRHFPDATEAIETLLSGHEIVCGSLVRLTHMVDRGGVDPVMSAALFERFEKAYAAHAREEVALLRTFGERLNEDQRRELARLVEGL